MNIVLNQAHGWIFLVLLAAVIFWALRLYRAVPPTVGPALRRGLVVLRIAALSCLFIALIEPVLAVSRTVRERPIVAALIDSSRSMAIRDGTGGVTRAEEALSLLNEFVLPRIARDAEVKGYAFAEGLTDVAASGRAVRDVPPPEGPATDLGGALASLRSELSGRNLAAVVVATDGASNKGGSPYDAGLALGVPVFVLGLGSAEPAADIAVRDVTTNRVSYVGEGLPIEVRVTSAGFAGAETVIELAEDGVLLDSRTIGLSGGGEETVVTFRVVPATPGVHRYTVSIPEGPSELTTANNERVVATNALKGKIRLLAVGSRPGWDFAFLKREFESDRNVEATCVAVTEGAVVTPSATLPASLATLLEYDMVVLVEPDLSDPPVPAAWLARFVRERGGGLLVLGPSPGSAAGDLASILPIAAPARFGYDLESRVRLTDVGASAPTTRVVADRFENDDVWRSLPPIWVPTVAPAPRADAQVLVGAATSEGETPPVVAAGRTGAGGVMVVLVRGLWRWKMAGPEGADLYGRFLANVARWLTARGELERLVVGTDKDVYVSGERVGFTAQVYREDYRLVGDASVTVSAGSGGGAAPVGSVTLAPDGDYYRGEMGPLAPGRYVFDAQAVLSGEEVGTASGEFTVETMSLEDAETRRRTSVLEKLADESRGGSFLPETIESVPESMTFDWVKRVATREFEIWDSPWLLSAFVGLLSLEWTLRRRKGMP